MSDASLAETLSRVWDMLEDGVSNPDAPARLPVLATAGLQGGGRARIVVLRDVDRAEKALTLYTHSQSSKVGELSSNPAAEMLIWDPPAMFQVRLSCEIAMESASDALWQTLGDGAKQNYAAGTPPGAEIAAPGIGIGAPRQDHCLVLTARLRRIDTLSLADLPHERARFEGPAFDGRWIAP